MTTPLIYRRVSVNFGQPGEEGFRLDSTRGFRIGFQVKFTSRSRPNKAKVKFWNLSKRSVDLLERDGTILALVAGYREKQGQLIKGDVTTVTHSTDDNNRITECTVKDAGLIYRNARFDYHFAGGTTNRRIVRTIAEGMGVGVGFGLDTLPKVVYDGDITFNGSARDALNEILGDSGAQWSLVEGNLQILASDDESTQENGILLTDDTGKIKVESKKKGVEVVGLLQPEIRPGRLLRIISRKIEGDFVARTVEHTGDSDEGAHTTKVLARRIVSLTFPRERKRGNR